MLSVPCGNRHDVPEEHTVLAQFQPLLQTIGACPSQFAWRPPADMCQAAHVSPGRCCWEESGSNCTQVPRARVWQFRQRCHHLRQLGQQAQAALANTFSCISETISFTMGDSFIHWTGPRTRLFTKESFGHWILTSELSSVTE